MTLEKDDIGDVTDLLAKTKVAQLNLLSFKGRSLKLNTAEDAADICNEIKNSKDVQALCLEGNTIGVDAAKAIADTLRNRPEFERALWSDMFTGRVRTEIPPAMEALSDAIISSKAKLVELDLSDNAFGPDGVKACVKLLTSPACYSLKILRFNNNGLGIGGGKLLAKALLDNHKASSETGSPLALEVFISGRNRLENQGSKALAVAFKTIGTLQEIQMPQNGIQHEGISALAESFRSNPSLKMINLNDNIFTEKGSKSMAQVFPSLNSVEVINFGDCLVKTEGAIAIAEACTNALPNLKELNLSFDEIKKEAAILVVKAVQNKEGFEKLDLNGNCLGDGGVEELRSILEAADQADLLGSLSDDEGDEDDDEEEDLDNLCESDNSDEGEEVEDLSLQVEGVSIKPQSPLLGDDVQIQEQLEKEPSPEDIADFLSSPSLQKFKAFPNKRSRELLRAALKDEEFKSYKIGSCFVKVSANLEENADAISVCADAILESAVSSPNYEEGELVTAILVHLGFLKSEHKVQPERNLAGPLIALQHAAKQQYFTKSMAAYFIAFLARPDNKLEHYSSTRHGLLQALYQV